MNASRRPRLRLSPGLLALVLLLATVALAMSLFVATQRSVTLVINGITFQHRTHQATTTGVLRELGLTLGDADQLSAPSAAELRRGTPIRIEAARHVRLVHDGALS